MKCFLIIKIFFVVNAFSHYSNGAKILSIFGYPGPSQYIMASALLKGLAEKGHEVTSISTFPQKHQIHNFRDIAVMENAKLFVEVAKEKSPMDGINDMIVAGNRMATNVLENSEVKDIMNNEKFDLVIIETLMSEALFGLGEHFKAPIVAVSTLGTVSVLDYLVGNTSPLSYIPNLFIPLDNHTNLKQRFWNVISNVIVSLYTEYVILPDQEMLYKKYFPAASLTFDEARRNVSLVLVNQHFSLSFPRPYVPNMIEVGGLHIKQQADPLPLDLQEFLDNATDGAIYFSMGSNMKSKDFSSDSINIFLDAFSDLNIKVLWKFENDSLANKPDNVLIKSWYPQPSILAHPNVKLFITHGGLLSTTETLFYGKPMLGIPVFADQPSNVMNAVNAGYALSLKLENITKDSLKATILELLTNDRYTKTAQAVSKRFKDQPQTPLERAIYWIEYVLRHEGAVHMRNAGVDLNFWQYHNIDVFAILIGFFVLFFMSIILVIYFLKKLLCSKKSMKKLHKTKKA